MSIKTNWEFLDSEDQLDICTKMFGKPTAITKQKGGFAVWDEKKLFGRKIRSGTLKGLKNCFSEILLRDESIEHFCPAKHYDFLYSYVKISVDPNQIQKLMSVSGSVSYDPLKNFVSARCASIEANIATLKLVTDLLLNNKVEIRELGIKYQTIRSVHSSGAYGKLIKSTIDPKFVVKYYKDLCKNVRKLNQKSKLNKGYWKGAFSYKNKKCLTPRK